MSSTPNDDPFLKLAADFDTPPPPGFFEVAQERRAILVAYHVRDDPYKIWGDQTPASIVEEVAREMGYPGIGQQVYDYLIGKEDLKFPGKEDGNGQA